MMETIVAIDASEVGPIMKYLGLDGLITIAKRGDHFFYSKDFEVELERSGFLKSPNGKLFEAWIKKQRNPPKGYTPDVSIAEIDDVLIDEMDDYDPNQKRKTKKGGYETWDMSIRKRMALHPQFDYEIISREKDFYENKNRNNFDPVTRKHAKIVDVPFRYTTMKKLMAVMVVHPDLNLTREQYENIRDNWRTAFGETKGRDQGFLYFPPTYEEALRQRAFRSKPRGETFGLSSQANARLGVAPVDQGSAVPLSPSGAPLKGQLDGLTGSQSGGEIGGRIDPEAGLSGKASGSLQEGPSIGRRFMTMLRKGAPVVVLGLAIPPVFSAVRARAEERNIPFDQAARELGLEFGEEEFKDLAAEAGVDLAITFTPIGPLKKAWDVLGNIDDIVSLMRLYGDAYPDNETIQQMAALADEVADSAALAAYVDGRDALTGAVGGAIDFVFGSASSEEETAEAIGKLRGAIREGSAELDEAVSQGATAEELSDLLIRQAEESAPAPLVAPDFRNPDLSPERVLEGEAPLSDVEQLPGSDPILPSALLPEAGAGAVDEVRAPVERAVEPGEDRFARKTSYDTYRKLGRTPEEEKEALAHFEDLRRESYLDTGNLYMAEEIAVALFKLQWDRSAFAADDGTVMKYPVEKAYTDPEGDGHGYVRADVETLLKREGIQARRWYLEPNGKTASDRARGIMDRDGYGPRMTLSYDDEAGQRHVLTDAFQAHVNVARQRRRAELEREDRERAKQYGIDWPETRDMKPFEVARTRLLHAATLPELRQQPTDKMAVDARPVPVERNETLPPEPSATQSLAGSGPKKQGGESRPFLFSKGI
ncbi:hypothetical protein [Roseibium sp. MMSF_3544]|uniref:hypothetical protein n=1 Tax=unclassified Roseibium TaxID=2629323 RepID=UPI00273D4E6C|nr:hypothetical protein [Roseibium sp. MMSF_3544]